MSRIGSLPPLMANPTDVSLRWAVMPSGMATRAKAMQATDMEMRLLISVITATRRGNSSTVGR